MSNRWKPFVVLSVASAASALLTSPVAAVTEVQLNRAAICTAANPSEAAVVYNFQGTLTNTNASGKEVICPVKMPQYLTNGDDIYVSIYGTASGNGVSCVLYITGVDNVSSVIASTSGSTVTDGWVGLSLEANGWPSGGVTANVKCYVQNDEQVTSVNQIVTY